MILRMRNNKVEKRNSMNINENGYGNCWDNSSSIPMNTKFKTAKIVSVENSVIHLFIINCFVLNDLIVMKSDDCM